jgi:translation initiation factor IF-3
MRVNQRIRVPEVRVVMEDGEQKGIMPTREAQALAQELGLDLVEISARSHPPVCRIMDYGKFKYEQSKKKKHAKKHASTVELKEIKFRPKTEEHDMDFKVKHVRRFVEEGNKCRLVIIFRGREITHPETGRAVLNRVVEATQDIANVEVQPNMEGRRMVMILAPKSGVVRRTRQAKEAKEAKSEGKSKLDLELEIGARPPSQTDSQADSELDGGSEDESDDMSDDTSDDMSDDTSDDMSDDMSDDTSDDMSDDASEDEPSGADPTDSPPVE